LIDSTAIARLIPHAGSMCLLQGVSAWDGRSIRCVADSHRDPANPLAVGGRLGSACAVEYAAQAMAVHGALTGVVGQRPSAGYLVSLRALTLHRPFLDDLEGDLVIKAKLLAGQGTRVSYSFTLTCLNAPVADGRAAVVLEAKP
jgi:predicted hotdog family 3-hydroxylacyl-ACP dehydratase